MIIERVQCVPPAPGGAWSRWTSPPASTGEPGGAAASRSRRARASPFFRLKTWPPAAAGGGALWGDPARRHRHPPKRRSRASRPKPSSTRPASRARRSRTWAPKATRINCGAVLVLSGGGASREKKPPALRCARAPASSRWRARPMRSRKTPRTWPAVMVAPVRYDERIRGAARRRAKARYRARPRRGRRPGFAQARHGGADPARGAPDDRARRRRAGEQRRRRGAA